MIGRNTKATAAKIGNGTAHRAAPSRPELELVSEESRDRRLLRALDIERSGRFPRRALTDALARNGLRSDDVRLKESMGRLSAYPEETFLEARQMTEVIRPNVSLIERALRGNLVIPDF